MWINGSFVEQAQISVLDHGLTVGDGVFETIKTINGEPFALTRHLDRLRTSAQGMLLPLPDEHVVTHGINQVLGRESFPIGRLRVTWTAGAGGAGSKRAEVMAPTLIITHHEAKPWPESAKVAIVKWPRSDRSPLVHLKTISYAENVLALAQAQADGADEAIFFNYSDHLCEGTGSNVIVRVRDQWLTPALECGALAGITRALAIKWCGVEEAFITREEFVRADEVVLASSTRDLQPVSMVDGRPLTGWKSAATNALVARFSEMAKLDLNP